MKKRLLLHICCAPDATIGLERIAVEYDTEGFFCNPNIYPKEEYQRRLQAMGSLSQATGFSFREGPCDAEAWAESVRGLEEEPEGGKRCEECLRLRIRQTARAAKEGGFDLFAAVLTVSPHKDAELVNRLGEEAARDFEVRYLPTDLKKRDGFKRSVELSNKYGIYRQNYCGCIFSLPPDKR